MNNRTRRKDIDRPYCESIDRSVSPLSDLMSVWCLRRKQDNNVCVDEAFTNTAEARVSQIRFAVIGGDAVSHGVSDVIRNRYRRQVFNGAASRYRLFAGAKACIQITPIAAHRNVHFRATCNKLSPPRENMRRKRRLVIGPGPDFIRFPVRRCYEIAARTTYRTAGEWKLRIQPLPTINNVGDSFFRIFRPSFSWK